MYPEFNPISPFHHFRSGSSDCPKKDVERRRWSLQRRAVVDFFLDLTAENPMKPAFFGGEFKS